MSWDKAIKFVLDYEGRSYENHPMDTGGETKFGISKKAYPKEDIKALTEERAKEIYRRDYWDPIQGNNIPEKLAAAIFDCAVNQGRPTAIRLFQSMMGLTADGNFGPKTIAAARKTSDYHVHLYLLHRARQYMKTKGVDFWGGNWGTRLIQFQEVFLFK